MSDIDKPAITTSLGALRTHFRDAQKPEASRQESKGDTLTSLTRRSIDHIAQRADDLTRHSKTHFAKHRDTWINRQYGELLKSSGTSPELTPSGMRQDKSAHLRRAAANLVDHRQYKRVRNIQRAMVNEVKQVATQGIAKARVNKRDRDQGR